VKDRPAPRTAAPSASARRRVALIVPFGEPSESFFPDTLLSWLSARARAAGHESRVVRVYYDGRSEERDERVSARLSSWLEDFAPTDVLVERTFDLEPLLAARARSGCRLVMVCRGDGFEPDPRLDAWIGRSPGQHRGRTRRTPTVGDLVAGFDALLAGRPPPDAPVRALPEVELDLEHDVIALEPTARLLAPRTRTVFGDAGCPYAADPRREPFYAGLFPIAGADPELALLGCAFCPMGGDYQASDEDLLLPWIAAQARAIRRAAPETEALVLSDQAPLPYLARLLSETADLAPLRWLVAMRADVLLRERRRLARALEVAARVGHRVEVYLTGFESFSDRELGRYLKGVRAAELVAAAQAMRALAREHPTSFSHATAKGHSLILWSPWTAPEDLAASLRTVRREGLGELFSELGRNRLRLTHELPITRAAARDGALLDGWPEGDEGAARRKGYSPDRPWRFLDPRTARAHRMAEALRERLGPETEVAQLLAASALAEDPALDDARVVRALAELEDLDATLARWLGPGRDRSAPRRAGFVRSLVVDLGLACGCGDPACGERDLWVDPDAAGARLEAALALGPEGIVLAGGDAALHPALEGLTAMVAAAGVPVGLALPRPVAVRAPLPLAALLVDLPVEAARAGAWLEGLAAWRTAFPRGAGVALEARVLLGREPLGDGGPALVGAISARLDADVLRVVVSLDAVGLGALARARDEVEALAGSCADAGVAFEVTPLSAGPRWRERMPRLTPDRDPARR
jgi:hypothetical protein